MPPILIDMRSADDSRDVVHRAVQALAEGKVIAIPTETTYALAASALSETAVEQLQKLAAPSAGYARLTLAVRSCEEAMDYVPAMSKLAMRLARRCWPGPVTLVVDDSHPDTLLQQLPAITRAAVSPSKTVNLRVPAHAAVLEVLRLLAGPIVLTNATLDGPSSNPAGTPPAKGKAEAVTAQEVVQAFGDQIQLVLDDGRARIGQPSSVVRVFNGNFEILSQGVVSQQTLQRLASIMVLFVCTGNTCRSPMAEIMFRQLVSQRLGCKIDEVDEHGVIVMSAGISAMMGGRAAVEAMTIMGQMGLDLASHESQPLTDQLVQHADLILVMTESHRQAILAEWPEAADRVKLLSRSGADIADPIGAPAEQYRRCAEQLKSELEVWAAELEL